MQNINKTVVKSMKLLDLFRTRSSLTLNEMVELTGLPKTSTHRMIVSLEEVGLLQKDHTGTYSLGMIFLEFGQLVSDRIDLRQLALPIMKDLRDEIGEAVNLTIKDRAEALYIEKLDTSHPVRLFTKVGRRSPLYAGACSRIILAHLSEEEMENYLKGQALLSYGEGTITDPTLLREVLNTSRLEGYTVSHSELENGTTALAAPIFDYKGQIAGGLSIAGPSDRFDEQQLAKMIQKVKASAAKISHALGYR
ncbi:IclR family transcriptional regulator [Alkalihalophilus lindianensis]|uniref:IclR family transcriptional regulator n=1 Tax=Alkalihalophilus lindianensis TaxID=1630542 RepID=A0ABU3XCY5_9BACI|nr:IclR family transcriptional regulator [Alkalihalophilus lindianensis]MDV2685745.1 IclR family transcriptional regulator [Alkalihalophilus lindianensis]